MNTKNHILIIDDNVGLCYSLRNVFEDKGFLVTTAHTGEDGMAILRQERVNIVLLDVRLPDALGTDLLPAIHQIEPDMPVLLITAYASLETAMQALNMGAYAYLIKPLDVGAALSAIQRVLERAYLIEQEKNLTQQLEQELAERKRTEAALKESEKQLKASLHEKEILLKEIHHRVKNNLQIVSTLLELQADVAQDERFHEVVRESQNRIHSMANVHELLYQSGDLSRIDAKRYIEELVNDLSNAYGAHTIRIELDITEMPMDVEQAVPCGLIINELVSNALKYAFPSNGINDIENKEIRIALHLQDNGHLELLIVDNGVGLPANLDPENIKTLGLQLVKMLTRQLRGAVEMDRMNRQGILWRIVFPQYYSESAKGHPALAEDPRIAATADVET